MPRDQRESTLQADGIKANGRAAVDGHLLNTTQQQSNRNYGQKSIPEVAHAAPDHKQLPQLQRRITSTPINPLQHAMHNQVTQVHHQVPSR